MDRIAEMVVDKIISRQKAYDEEFKAEIQEMVGKDADVGIRNYNRRRNNCRRTS